jgi:hypothetical protein
MMKKVRRKMKKKKEKEEESWEMCVDLYVSFFL